jgi:hypothetical protein
MDDISFEVFAARLDHRFVLRRHDTAEPGEPVAAVLVECTPQPANDRSTGYSLTFRAPLPAPAEQGNYLVESEGLTPTRIFLVPVRQTTDGLDFQAVFNQLTGDVHAL